MTNEFWYTVIIAISCATGLASQGIKEFFEYHREIMRANATRRFDNGVIELEDVALEILPVLLQHHDDSTSAIDDAFSVARQFIMENERQQHIHKFTDSGVEAVEEELHLPA